MKHEDAISASAVQSGFCRNKTVVNAFSWDNTARLWGCASGKPLVAHEASKRSIQRQSGWSTMVTPQMISLARLWDA
jgi:hypothetical protein